MSFGNGRCYGKIMQEESTQTSDKVNMLQEASMQTVLESEMLEANKKHKDRPSKQAAIQTYYLICTHTFIQTVKIKSKSCGVETCN